MTKAIRIHETGGADVLTWEDVEVGRPGHVRIEIGQTYPLADIGKAHRDLEGRKTTGSTVLIP